MNNLKISTNANEKSGYDINTSCYKTLIPNELIEGYTAEYAMFTTYSLDVGWFTDIVCDLKLTKLVNDNKVDCFCNYLGVNELGSSNRILASECLHRVKVSKFDKSGSERYYSFHPKLILIKYTKAGETRYLACVLSKNLTRSKLLDCYITLYADVKEESSNTNGAKLSGFIEDVFQKSNADPKSDNLFEELKKADFKLFGCDDVGIEFLNACDMEKSIEPLKDLHIISPFISDKKTEHAVKVLSEASELDKLSVTSEEDKFYDILIAFDMEYNSLHAKIYFGNTTDCKTDNIGSAEASDNKATEPDNETVIILGSSNATTNGFGNNCELNVKLVFPDKDRKLVDAIWDGIDAKSQYSNEKSETNTTSDRELSQAFAAFVASIKIKRSQNDDKYQLTAICDEKYKYYVDSEVFIQGEATVETNNSYITLKLEEPAEQNDTPKAISCEYDIYDYMSGAEKENADKQLQATRKAALQQKLNRIMGTSGSFSNTHLNSERNGTSSASHSLAKTNTFEIIKRLAAGSDWKEKIRLMIQQYEEFNITDDQLYRAIKEIAKKIDMGEK